MPLSISDLPNLHLLEKKMKKKKLPGLTNFCGVVRLTPIFCNFIVPINWAPKEKKNLAVSTVKTYHWSLFKLTIIKANNDPEKFQKL